jgi:hypothetical protein
LDAVVLYGPNDVRIDDEPDLHGDVETREIQIRTIATGLSTGTELTVYSGRFGIPFYGWPWGYPSSTGYLFSAQATANALHWAFGLLAEDPAIVPGIVRPRW